jgi:hypothetical protein
VKRNRRRATVLTISAFALVVLAAGWSRGHFVGDQIGYTDGSSGWGFAHGRGDVALVHWTKDPFIGPGRIGWYHQPDPPTPVSHNLPERVVGLFGYGVCRYRGSFVEKYDALTLPYGSFVAVAATSWLLLAWRYWRDRAARRIAAGLCAACGYDLRGGHDRCPECGAIAPPRSPAPSPA